MGRARVLPVASEAAPPAKTSGLAHVITTLAATLTEHGVDATILMPAYPAALDGVAGLRQVGQTFDDFFLKAGILLPGARAPFEHTLLPCAARSGKDAAAVRKRA
jgi:starch synthase